MAFSSSWGSSLLLLFARRWGPGGAMPAKRLCRVSAGSGKQCYGGGGRLAGGGAEASAPRNPRNSQAACNRFYK